MYTRKPLPRGFPSFFLFCEVMEDKMKTCNNCNNKPKEMTKVTMSSADWQRNEQRHEKREKRHWILEIILVALLVFSNIAWIIYEAQFETVEAITEEYDIEQDAEGGNNNSIINGGSIVNGEAEDKVQENNNENP